MRKKLSVIILLLSYPLQLHAFLPNYLDWKLSATVGVDPTTLSVIQGLPENTRKQAVLFINDALPLLDNSIYGYLKRVNEIITNQQVGLICTVNAIAATTLDQVILKYPFLGRVTPLSDLEKNWRKIESNFSSSTSAHEYMMKYTDYIYRIGLIKCKLQIAPSSNSVATNILADATARWSIWLALDKKCSTAKDCLNKVYIETEKLIKSSDLRDIEAVNAVADFKAISIPKESFFNYRFDYKAYEYALLALNNISSGVLLAKISREKKEMVQAQEISILSRLNETYNKINEVYDMILVQYKHGGNLSFLYNIQRNIDENLKTLDSLEITLSNSQASDGLTKNKKNDIASKITVLKENLNLFNSKILKDIENLHDERELEFERRLEPPFV